MLFWLALTGMLIWRFVVYEPPQPVMSKAGVLDPPRMRQIFDGTGSCYL